MLFFAQISILLPAAVDAQQTKGSIPLFRQASPAGVIAVGVLILILLGVVVALELWRQRREMRRKLQIQWEGFEDLAQVRGLGDGDRQILKQLHGCLESLHSPDALLRIPAVYDRALDAWLEQQSGGQSTDALNRAPGGPEAKVFATVDEATWIHLEKIRRHLGFKGLSNETSLSHTRQISEGLSVRIATEEGDLLTVGTVAFNHEDHMELIPESHFRLPAGALLRLSFSRQGDGEYKVVVPLLHLDTDTSRLWVGHSPKLSRQQLRMWVRVPVFLPGKIRNIVNPDGVLPGLDIDVTLLDLSGGGAMVNSKKPLEIEARGVMDFLLGDTKIEALGFVMLRLGKQARDGGQICHLCWDNIEIQAQERIMRYVFERQRGGLK